MKIIGDVHGKLKEYKKIVDYCDSSICVGDFGFKKEWDWHITNIDGLRHKINMGNHDFIPYSHCGPSLKDWTWIEDTKIFTIRGANSIDKHLRTEGRDWFPFEELTYAEGLNCLDLYTQTKPKIVISHDCPHSIRKYLFGINDKSLTSNLLQALFEEHQPELWIFGHHHRSVKCKKGKTQFICLSELETFEI